MARVIPAHVADELERCEDLTEVLHTGCIIHCAERESRINLAKVGHSSSYRVLRLVLNHLYPQSATVADVKADVVYLAAIIAAIEHHIKPGDGLLFTAAEPSFLALPASQQQRAAAIQLGLLRTLLGGLMVRSWLADVFRPGQSAPFLWRDCKTVQADCDSAVANRYDRLVATCKKRATGSHKSSAFRPSRK